MVEHGFQSYSKDAAAKLCNQTGGAAAGDECVWGKYREEPWNQTKQMRQRGQKFRLQVRRKSVLFRYPSLNLELRWLTPGTDP